jgi:hypothetical protein
MAQLSADARAAAEDDEDKASVSTSASVLSERRRLPTRCAAQARERLETGAAAAAGGIPKPAWTPASNGLCECRLTVLARVAVGVAQQE